ncbi:hypothetical protein RHMOL_Rhmol06G0215300 [Rhododendron molle]|uniref:Uncharacterized protein n=1 Tax=Rhododendron molle TaxID=49168 RepID=A0ACC0NGU7_RHOML|nr:hypothetical protein RHMOL_Rhmol06G0215300 [Rhododendron molle]
MAMMTMTITTTKRTAMKKANDRSTILYLCNPPLNGFFELGNDRAPFRRRLLRFCFDRFVLVFFYERGKKKPSCAIALNSAVKDKQSGEISNIKKMVRDLNIDMLLLQETKLKDILKAVIGSLGGVTDCDYLEVDTIGSAFFSFPFSKRLLAVLGDY